MLNKIYFFLFLTFFIKVSAEPIAFFKTEKKWSVVNPKAYSKLVKIGFIKNERSSFNPSINLAIENTTASLEEYCQASKEAHELDPNTTYTIIDAISLKDGKASLCQINKKINSLSVKMLQLIFIKDTRVYVMTAASKKKDFLNHYQSFINMFSSLKISNDIFSIVENKTTRQNLKAKCDELIDDLKNTTKTRQKTKKLKIFEKYLGKKFDNLGKYFQILILQKILQETEGKEK